MCVSNKNTSPIAEVVQEVDEVRAAEELEQDRRTVERLLRTLEQVGLTNLELKNSVQMITDSIRQQQELLDHLIQLHSGGDVNNNNNNEEAPWQQDDVQEGDVEEPEQPEQGDDDSKEGAPTH